MPAKIQRGSALKNERVWGISVALTPMMGSEQYRLSEFWLKESDLLIPMTGQADSLNIAMATIITLFEAVRQRNG